MADPTYRFRLSLARKEETCRLGADALLRSGKATGSSIVYKDIRAVRIYRSPGMPGLGGPAASTFERCVIRPKHGRPAVLSSNHFAGFGKFEDRSQAFRPFVDDLVRRVADANPDTVFIAGMPAMLWWAWILILLATVIVAPLAAVLIIVQLINGDPVSPPLILVTVLLLGVLFSLASYARTVRRNRPRRFDPRNLQTGASPLDDLRR
jgi:hypothetical protein